MTKVEQLHLIPNAEGKSFFLRKPYKLAPEEEKIIAILEDVLCGERQVDWNYNGELQIVDVALRKPRTELIRLGTMEFYDIKPTVRLNLTQGVIAYKYSFIEDQIVIEKVSDVYVEKDTLFVTGMVDEHQVQLSVNSEGMSAFWCPLPLRCDSACKSGL